MLKYKEDIIAQYIQLGIDGVIFDRNLLLVIHELYPMASSYIGFVIQYGNSLVRTKDIWKHCKFSNRDALEVCSLWRRPAGVCFDFVVWPFVQIVCCLSCVDDRQPCVILLVFTNKMVRKRLYSVLLTIYYGVLYFVADVSSDLISAFCPDRRTCVARDVIKKICR